MGGWIGFHRGGWIGDSVWGGWIGILLGDLNGDGVLVMGISGSKEGFYLGIWVF